MTVEALSQNLAPAMKSEYALSLRECRLSAPFEQPWGRPYRLVEWVMKDDPCVRRRVVPVDCTTSQIAAVLRAHVPGRRCGPGDADL